MDEKASRDELMEIAIESADGIMTLLDIMADGEPDGWDWGEQDKKVKQRVDRSMELVHMLSKKQILAAPDIKSELVNVPEWGGDVMVYGLTGTQRGELESSIIEMKGQTQIMHLQNLKVLTCSLAIRDEDGARMFDADELGELGAKSAQAIERIYGVTTRLSGLSKQDVEELAKNFVSEGNGVSGSASPVT